MVSADRLLDEQNKQPYYALRARSTRPRWVS